MSIAEHHDRFWSWTTAAITAVAVASYLATLHFMGRIPWAATGFGFWTSQADGPLTSQTFADPYSLSHILHGLIFYYALYLLLQKVPLRWRFFIAIMLELSWEILENTPFIIGKYRSETMSHDYRGDTMVNSFGDVSFMVFGFWLASRMSWKWAIALFVFLELGMLVTIRDNLTLNIIMLIHPFPSILQWQAGR